MTGVSGAQWRRVLARLAGEYHARARSADGEGIEQRLRRLLALADPTHPLRMALSLPPKDRR